MSRHYYPLRFLQAASVLGEAAQTPQLHWLDRSHSYWLPLLLTASLEKLLDLSEPSLPLLENGIKVTTLRGRCEGEMS